MLRILSTFLLFISPLLQAAEEKIPATMEMQLSPVAQRLTACSETANGMQQRLSIILHELSRESRFYHTDYLPTPQLELIPVTVSLGTPQHLGGTQWAAGNAQVSFRMNFFTAALPTATDAATRVQRELTLVDTLVHELAHCYFFARYPKLGKTNTEAALCICEGYAIHVARTFMQQHYFPHRPEALDFYENTFLSPRYRRLYRDFRRLFLSPAGSILWQRIDAWELRVAPPGYVLRNRSQIRVSGMRMPG